jgi:hypothetical protein
MRTTAGPVPAERTKMSAPAGLWTIWDLKVEGKAGCAAAVCAEASAIANAIRVLAMILERRSIQFSFGVCGSINITSAGSVGTLSGVVRWGTASASAKAKVRLVELSHRPVVAAAREEEEADPFGMTTKADTA